MKHILFANLILAFSLMTTPASAKSNFQFSNAWIRATPPNAQVAGGFLTIMNSGNEDRLLSATSNLAKTVEIHEMKTVDGVMQMRKITGGLETPAGKTITLKPGGYHLMLISPKQTFAEGQKVTISLVFERSGKHDVVFKVLKAAPKSADPEHDQH
jgi:copper(I)-binding protein